MVTGVSLGATAVTVPSVTEATAGLEELQTPPEILGVSIMALPVASGLTPPVNVGAGLSNMVNVHL